jgi:hypothetical protein
MYGSSDNRFGDFLFPSPDKEAADSRTSAGVRAPNCLLEQTRRDALSLPAISVALRRWALQQQDVKQIAVGYGGTQYSVAILLTELQFERFSTLYTELDHVLGKFGESIVLLYPLGPTQQESLLLNSADCYTVYPV